MKLADFFACLGPYLEGQATHEETAAALYGGDPARANDAQRLAIYGRFCRIHRFEVVDPLFAHTRAAVVALRGLPEWERLVGEFFRASPMHHVELSENGEGLPAFLSESPAASGLPPWIAELADLEWWEWRAAIAPDDAADAAPDQGPLRVASTVDLRPYGHALVGWLDWPEAGSEGYEGGEGPRPAAPAPGRSVVLFWRDRGLHGRRELATALEMAVLRAVLGGLSPLAPGVVALADQADLAETVEDLRAAGVLLGVA